MIAQKTLSQKEDYIWEQFENCRIQNFIYYTVYTVLAGDDFQLVLEVLFNSVYTKITLHYV